MFLCDEKAPQGAINNFGPNTNVEIADMEGTINLKKIMPLAEAARARNPIKFGTTPFIGKDSKEPLIYQAIELSADKKRVISGPRVMMQRDRIDVPVPLSFLCLTTDQVTRMKKVTRIVTRKMTAR